MKRIGILGDIGSGKTYIAKCFGFPVFNADLEVAKIYKHDRKVFQKLQKELPNYFSSFPVKKKEIINAILSNRKNLKKRFSDINVVDWGNQPDFDMIINATSLGLSKGDDISLNFENIDKGKLFYDVIYNPSETNFLRTGKSLGCQVCNGKMMFIYQAYEAFKLWHKVKPIINEELMKFLDL